VARAHRRIGRVTAIGAVLYVLSRVGAIVVRGTLRAQARLDGWAQARREREEDRKLWELALADPRVMADLIALQQHAERQS
jgi:hypothetical protein